MKAKYAILENKDCWQMPMVLQLTSPYILGQVLQATTQEDAAQILEKIVQHRKGGAKILGYRIFIAEAGSLLDYTMHPEDLDKYARVFREMADFYLEYKVSKKPYIYKRYREEL